LMRESLGEWKDDMLNLLFAEDQQTAHDASTEG